MNTYNSIQVNSNNTSVQQVDNNNSNLNNLPKEYTQELQNEFEKILSNKSDLSQNSIINNNDENYSLSENFKLKDSELKNISSEIMDNKQSNLKNDLSSIFSQLMSNTQNTAVNQNDLNIAITDSPNSSVQDTQKIINELVERILISDQNTNGSQEVIIKLGQNSVLEGTEIILTRSLDGSLSVLINPKDRDQFKTLIEAKQDLEFSLQKHEKGMINVTITDLSQQYEYPNENHYI